MTQYKKVFTNLEHIIITVINSLALKEIKCQKIVNQ